MKNENEKRGGKRPFSGAKPKYGEPTKTIAFRVPESKIEEIKAIVQQKLYR
jgi:hypothetical protein